MGKPSAERRLADNEALARVKRLRTSPQKLNLIAASIRGKRCETALAELTFSRRRIAGSVKKVLEAAIANYRTGDSTARKLEGHITCICFGISDKDIERAVVENHLSTVEEVTNYTKAGGGCAGCHGEIAEIIESG